MRAPLGREGLDDQPQRSRYQNRCADALQHTERNQFPDAFGDRAQPGRDGEQRHPKMNTRLRPIRSASLPAATRNAAKTML